jgi:hypothetical protein
VLGSVVLCAVLKKWTLSLRQPIEHAGTHACNFLSFAVEICVPCNANTAQPGLFVCHREGEDAIVTTCDTVTVASVKAINSQCKLSCNGCRKFPTFLQFEALSIPFMFDSTSVQPLGVGHREEVSDKSRGPFRRGPARMDSAVMRRLNAPPLFGYLAIGRVQPTNPVLRLCCPES